MEPQEKLAMANEVLEFLAAKTRAKGTDALDNETQLEVLALVAKALRRSVTFTKDAAF